ncbi:MAG: aminopeptidase [Chitinispirillales bacterium]|jgi:predicted aminopeptidase|nr:aminopeptidase [Chitinispirillales bacterium]
MKTPRVNKNKRVILISTAIAAVVFAVAALSSGCCYIAKQGVGLIARQSRTVSIDKMLRDGGAEDVAPKMREFLLRVGDIRSFAMDTLGLKRNNNYKKYLRVDKDYAVDVVTASKDDAFEPYKWWFPVVGSVNYKGFFDKIDADREAQRIKKRGGYDVYMGHAAAFSTLGFFGDPVYSFMINYSVYDLASLIIHEQTHATVYVKNQTQLNEEIATFVGDVGGLLYVERRFGAGSEEYRAAVLSKEDYETYIGLMRSLHGELAALYDGDSGRGYKLSEKERIFTDFRSRVSSSYDSLFKTPTYAALKVTKLNNAVIAARMTYNMDMALYYELYESEGGDLAAVIKKLATLKSVKKGHKEYIGGMIKK